MTQERGRTTPYTRALFRTPMKGVGVGVLVLAIIALFLVPVRPTILDILLVMNLVIALVLLLRGLFVRNVVEFYSFPTILVLATLYRLALNVSSTRLILLNGDSGLDAAGRVIEAFGTFVVRGDFVVGAIVFCIIAGVNFVVIAKGSARVAEVSARFSLDALPGRQLAIDADLRAGSIRREDAERRREELARESRFFGAMDGGMKFVQGDAIAGLLITCINAVGGVAIGMSRGSTPMRFEEAVSTYGILTIGDGLVSIIPSLIISVCAGVVVTHVAGTRQEELGGQMASHLASEPLSLSIAGIALILLGLWPGVGLPLLPFTVVGGCVLFLGYSVATKKRTTSTKSGSAELLVGTLGEGFWDGRATSQEVIPVRTGTSLEGTTGALALEGRYLVSSHVEELTIEVDRAVLGPYLGGAQGFLDDFHRVVKSLEETTYRERGVRLPRVGLSVNELLGEGVYKIYVREQIVRTGRDLAR